MGLSTHVYGIRDMGDEFQTMLKVRDFCKNHGTSYPVEISNFFGYLVDESEETIKAEMLRVKLAVKNVAIDAVDRHTIEVADIPRGVKTIVFENSY